MIRLFLVVLLTQPILACGEEEGGGGPSPAAQNKGNQPPPPPPPKKKKETAETDEEEEAFLYRSDGVRDPFQPFIVTLHDEEKEQRCPLCVPLSGLTFTGAVTGIASPVALIETREGVGYFVRRGSELGANNGRIIDIREGVIVLRERFQDQLGRISVVDRTLRIRAKEVLADAVTNTEELVETGKPRPANGVLDPTEQERVKKSSGPADEL